MLEALSYGVFGVAGVVSLSFRFRRAGRVEREQIKWPAYAGPVLLTGSILSYAGSDSLSGLWFRQVGFALWVVGFAGVPVAIGVAMVKYRLCEIDLIMNRTLVYGAGGQLAPRNGRMLAGGVGSLAWPREPPALMKAGGRVPCLSAPCRSPRSSGCRS